MDPDENADPRAADVERIWRQNRCIKGSSISVYRRWVCRFTEYCRVCALLDRDELTLAGALRFVHWWHVRHTTIQLAHAVNSARSALAAWAFALRTLGEPLPPWDAPAPERPATTLLAQAFAAYLREVRGNPPSTIHKKLGHISIFDAHLRSSACGSCAVTLQEIDAFVVMCRDRYARTTVADICSTLRGYVRFLRVSGQVQNDLAGSIKSPIVRVHERLHRALPWHDVQRILRAVDRTSAVGRRDYAILLMMSAYGLGAGEIIRLGLDSIDWHAGTVHIVRPKTGVEFLLPLLPAVASALESYLRHGRPTHTDARQLFVTMNVPHKAFACSGTIRHILHSAARRAGVTAAFLGTHVLRHTHACRQLELGTEPKLIGDILGHRDPESTSAYLRVATERLRELSLPVPT